MKPLRISELLRYVDRIVRDDSILKRVQVEGEVVNLSRKRYTYFDLKDDRALVHCVDFDGVVPETVKDGAQVILLASAMVYPQQGKFELRAVAFEEKGRGQALLALEERKRRLEKEGLFRPERKRPLPLFPQVIGLITSVEGAVLHDFANEVKHRYPLAKIVVSPASVQGNNAAEEMRSALRTLFQPSADVMPDLVVLARGGGSAEDLGAFQDEQLVRDLAACPVPVISAVGHQVDITLCDLVADARASTPTEAAILVTPDAHTLHQSIDERMHRLSLHLQRLMDRRALYLENLQRRLEARRPSRRIEERRRRLQEQQYRLQTTFQKRIQRLRFSLDETIKTAASIREKRLAQTSWTVSDLKSRPVLAGELRVGSSYLLQSGAYRYRIAVEKKEKKDAL